VSSMAISIGNDDWEFHFDFGCQIDDCTVIRSDSESPNALPRIGFVSVNCAVSPYDTALRLLQSGENEMSPTRNMASLGSEKRMGSSRITNHSTDRQWRRNSPPRFNSPKRSSLFLGSDGNDDFSGQ
jgi:hypothetical protein